VIRSIVANLRTSQPSLWGECLTEGVLSVKIAGLLGVLLILCALIVVSVWAWLLWRWHRLCRRRAMFRVLADDLRLSCLHDGPSIRPKAKSPVDPPEVDAHIAGRLGGFHIDMYERLQIHRTQGVPTETQTVVEVSGFDIPLPTFRIMPADSHDRAIHKVLGTPQVSLGEDVDFNDNNTLTGRDKKGIQILFRAGVAEQFRKNTDLWLFSTGESLRFSRYERLLPLEEVKRLLSDALRVASAVREATEGGLGTGNEGGDASAPQTGAEMLSWWTKEDERD